METIVMYPCPGPSHLPSIVEFAKLIIKRHPSFSIVLLITLVPFDSDNSYLRRVSAANPSISFLTLPTVTLPPTPGIHFELARINVPDVRQALISISQTSKITAFLLDFFCYTSSEVSTGLNIQTYFFFTAAASSLCFFLSLPTLHGTITKDFKDADVLINVPGTPPIHTLDLPDFLYVRNSLTYKHLLNMSTSITKCSGILINSFEKLESRAFKALLGNECSLDKSNSPPVYPVGPLILTGESEGRDGEDKPGCLKWLDGQPEKSVVFLCFGNVRKLKAEQLSEMAVGLERSGHMFLWVVRGTPAQNGAPMKAEPELDSLLPEGFLERTKDRGFVMNTWAPQVDVLRHPSVGAFVSNCGWNSVLEAICNGVSIVSWPLYAEQRLNRRYVVEEFKVALPLEFSSEGFVTAAELEKRVRELMEKESGKVVRDRATALKEEANAAMQEGSPAYAKLAKLLDSLKPS